MGFEIEPMVSSFVSFLWRRMEDAKSGEKGQPGFGEALWWSVIQKSCSVDKRLFSFWYQDVNHANGT